MKNIVQTNTQYSYNSMKNDINIFKKLYPFLKFGSIGKSVLGKEIQYIKIGTGKKQLCYNASIHANEWITSILLMKFVEDFSNSYITNINLYGYNVKEIYNEVSIYVIPMLNPDGVDLVTNNITDKNILFKTKYISNNYPYIPYPNGWKANIEGIDLNLQFPAGFNIAKKIKYAKGYTSPAPKNFVGFDKLTAIESVNLYNFTLSHNFEIVLNYHSQGEVIYYKYLNYTPKNSFLIAKTFSKLSGYKLENVPFESSFAGYKDWFISQYNRPGFTIEVGMGENPLPLVQFNKIYKDNLPILLISTKLV
ncbi:MAG: M14 family metallocarboxypeptidase [Clostridia bacterium]